ncbi:helix-turn-helix transcriptional regulator [Bacillus massiliigorillae]|uniref:helix-turn-helix transcriptional regulator n=1 Tax=Bacillus massiliigorillae TaxID=1243664 RepID=UPI0003AAD72C|nr:YafY family protein [Bacillus massiliigorillae]
MKLERLLSILLLLLKEERITADFLAERFEVTKRTIYRDMESLLIAGIPIVTYSGKGGGYALLESYKLTVFTFSDEEKQLLLHSLDYRKELLEDNYTEELQQKIQQLSSEVQPASLRLSSPSIYRPEVDKEIKERMHCISTAIDSRREVSFAYVSYKGETTDRTVQPTAIVLRNGSWYVEAYCHLRGDERVFKLSRIRDLQIADTQTSIGNDIAKKSVELTVNRPPIDVRLQFTKNKLGIVYDYFSLDEIKEMTEEHVIVEFTYHFDYAIIPFILSFGDSVQILQPNELVEMLHVELNKIKSIYKS